MGVREQLALIVQKTVASVFTIIEPMEKRGREDLKSHIGNEEQL